MLTVSRVNEYGFMSTYPSNQPPSSIMSYCECGTGNCAADLFILTKGTKIEIGDIGGLGTFSMKEWRKSFGGYEDRRWNCVQKFCRNDTL